MKSSWILSHCVFLDAPLPVATEYYKLSQTFAEDEGTGVLERKKEKGTIYSTKNCS